MSKRQRNADWTAANLGFDVNQTYNARDFGMNIVANKFVEMAMARFEWHNLPETIPVRALEYTLLNSAMGCFCIEPKSDNLVFLPCSNVGMYNMYYDPTRVQVQGAGAIVNFLADAADIAITYCNETRIPDMVAIAHYANRIYELDRTIDVNALNLRHPFIVAGDEDTMPSLKKAYEQVVDGAPVLFTFKKMMHEQISSQISAFSTGVKGEDILDVIEARGRIWNEAMTVLGIKSANTTKKERLITNEVDSLDHQIKVSRTSALRARQTGAERCNELFGTDISVTFQDDSQDDTMEDEEFLEERGDDEL